MLFSYNSFISFFSIVFSRELDWFHPIFYSLLLTIYMWLNLSSDLLWPWNFLTNIFLQSLLAYSDSFSNPTGFSVKKKLETLNLKAFSTFNYKCLVFAIDFDVAFAALWCIWLLWWMRGGLRNMHVPAVFPSPYFDDHQTVP